MNFKSFFNRILTLLQVKPPVGGLEISDLALRFANLESGNWRTASLRLPPGIIENGQVKDHRQFVEALNTLHDEIAGPKNRKFINIVVSLSSVNVYTQVFSLPMIGGENLEKAIQLNIQMVSPGEVSQTYSGWQMVNEDQKSVRLEILSAFVNRPMVDEIHAALKEARFTVHSVESRALSLARLTRELAAEFDRQGSYVVLSIDSNGVEFLIMRRSQLYFQHFIAWRDIQGGEREMSQAAVEEAIVKNFQQVLNFYNGHWPDALGGIFISAGSLQGVVTNVVQRNFSLAVRDLVLNLPGEVSPDWFVALGSALRGLVPGREDREISLLGVSAREEFRRHQILSFIRVWRLLVPVSLSILLAAFLLADIFLIRTAKTLEEQIRSAGGAAESQEMVELQRKAQDFNRGVTLIGKTLTLLQPKIPFIEKISDLLRSNSGVLNRLTLQGFGPPVSLTGEAKTEGQILAFKKALEQDGAFQNVNIPLADIKPAGQGLSFSMSFSIVPPKTP